MWVFLSVLDACGRLGEVERSKKLTKKQVAPRAVGVICYKVVNGRYMEKRVNVRIEHVKHSKCRQEFLDRVKSNAAAKKEAKAKGEVVVLKRLPAQPREARTVSTKNNTPQTLAALPYETTI